MRAACRAIGLRSIFLDEARKHLSRLPVPSKAATRERPEAAMHPGAAPLKTHRSTPDVRSVSEAQPCGRLG